VVATSSSSQEVAACLRTVGTVELRSGETVRLTARRLDLDHPGARVGHQHRAVRPGGELGQVENGDSL
jgi:hypothetical protein